MIKEVIIAVLVIVVLVLGYLSAPHWVRMPSTNLEKGMSASFWKLLGVFPNEADCGHACNSAGGLKYMWDTITGEKGQCRCYVIPSGTMDDPNRNSAYFNPGLTNTLQRRLGSANAGSEKYSTNNCVGTFDCRPHERFSGDRVTQGTMYDGYYKGSVLPI